MERIDWQLSSLGLLFLAGIGWGFVEDCFQLLKKGKKRPVLDFIWPVSVILLAWSSLLIEIGLCLDYSGPGLFIIPETFPPAVAYILSK